MGYTKLPLLRKCFKQNNWNAFRNLAKIIKERNLDEYTKLLLHCDSFLDSSSNNHVISPTASGYFNFDKANGNDIGEGWSPSTSNGSYSTIVNNKIRNQVIADGDIAQASAFSTFDLSGDFDIQVDFTAVSFAQPSTSWNQITFVVNGASTAGGTNLFYIELHNYASGGKRYMCYWVNDGVFGTSSTVSTTNSAGKFKITRVGNAFKGYRWNGTSWILVGQTNGWSSNVTSIGMRAISTSNTTNLIADFDNFVINSGSVSSYPSPEISTNIKKLGSGSIKFDGDVSYVSVSSSEDWNFGTGDFTIDFWVYLLAFENWVGFLQTDDSMENGLSFEMYSNKLRAFARNNNVAAFDINEATISQELSLNTWIHCALVRHGESIKIYQDGVSIGNATTSAIVSTNGELMIGKRPDHFLDGYMDEIRISKGIARWTENFTPPTSAY